MDQPNIFDFAIPAHLAAAAAVHRLIAPPKPWYVLPTHFICLGDLQIIISTITALLSKLEVNYQFVPHVCAFHGMFVMPGKRSDFHIFIYKNDNHGFIIEFQKLDRDSDQSAFVYIMNLIQTALTATDPDVCDNDPGVNDNDPDDRDNDPSDNITIPMTGITISVTL